MFCNNCNTEISDAAKFCPKCGSPVAAPAPSNVPSPAVYGGEAAVKPRKKMNLLVILVPVISLAVLAAVVIVLYFTLFSKPDVSFSDFRNALEERDFALALEISEQLPKSDCEEIIEEYIIELLDTDGKEFEKNDRTVRKLFSNGFDKYRKIYKNYQNGEYSPKKPVPAQTIAIKAPEETTIWEQTDTANDIPSETTFQTKDTAYTTTAPVTTTEPAPVELPLSERVVGHWCKRVYSGCYEDIVFFDDGTGYIYSDIVSEKVSETNSSYLYHDGKIHFEWYADEYSVYIDADIDPYCFVAYQGFAAPGHRSNATWKGSKNGSHDYYFAYDTKDAYTCDMLGISSTSKLNSGESLTREFWSEFLKICDDAWDKYYNHSDQIDLNKYQIDYSTLADRYYDSPSLCAQYEDVDLYHFVLFTKMVLIGTDNSTTISLDFDLEDYDRVE